MAVLEDLMAVLNKRVKVLEEYGEYWRYEDVFEVLDCYEKHNIIAAGGMPLEKRGEGWETRLDYYWSYTGNNCLESIELARKVIKSMKGHDGLFIEVGGHNG